jgi:hypothetical protein
MKTTIDRPRYQALPSQVLDGYWRVLDTATQTHPLVGTPDQAEAIHKADVLNRQADARRVCRACHHKYPVADVIGGQCLSCRRAAK